MKFFDRLTVGGKLAVAFGAVLAAMALLGGFSLWQMSRLGDQLDLISEVRLAGVRDSLRMAESATRYRTREYRLAIAQPNEVETLIPLVAQAREVFEQAAKSYEAAIHDADERAIFDKAMAAWKHYVELTPPLVDAMRQGRIDEATDLVTVQGVQRFDAALALFKQLEKYNDDHAVADGDRADEIYANSRLLVVAVLLAAIAGGVAMAFAIARAITRPLGEAVQLAEAVSQGDLTRSLHASGRDEVAQLTRALGAMNQRLRELVSQVRMGVESVGTASAQIATGNQDLSARTEQTASNLQQTAASMEEITGTVAQSADTARQANQLAAGAAGAAERGGAVVERVVDSMHSISEASKKIADIIGVIDGIAFQTNILALNAAVEAARAGEQGRGFAVVAGEVRGLAQRSASAAKEIKTLIGSSVERVEAGAQLAGEAGASMGEIVSSVKRVSDLITEIAAAAQEQRDGIGQVNQAIGNLDQLTQQNAALVEESAAAAASMSEQARKLAEAVSVFRTGEPAGSAASAAHVARSQPRPASATALPKAAKPAAPKAAPVAPRATPPLAAAPAGDDDWTSF
ncbi:methyl-accepting chemotaxis protein [Caldimonas sp. KR1-144]|uniref:methyl-accepting chemotaxis protein n=1 Tax=Caldimonas sp. KR1-144 TaxID=3400911 RepID=UPI003BFD77AC